MNKWQSLKNSPSITHPLAKIEKLVYRLAINTLHLGSTLMCVPYKLENPKDFSSLNLKFSSWYQFLLVTTLLCLHSIAQWIYFFYYTQSHGLNVQACLHLNFLAIYTFSFIFSLALISKPDALVDVHNQIQGIQESFEKSWTRHPVIVLVVVAMRAFLYIVPLISVGLHILDSTMPMFVVTNILNAGSDAVSITGYHVMKNILAAALESALLFLSVLTMFSVGQTCAVLDIALNIWMQDLRNRMKKTEILNSRTWMSFDKLYQKIQVFSILSNNLWGSIIVPGCTVLVVLLSVSSIFCTLRLHGHLHPVVYAFFPVLAVFMLGGIVFGVFGQLSKVNRNANACLDEIVNEGRKLKVLWVWNGDNHSRMLYVGKKLKAFRSFGVQTGSFGYLTLNTQIDMLDQIINYVILLLSL